MTQQHTRPSPVYLVDDEPVAPDAADACPVTWYRGERRYDRPVVRCFADPAALLSVLDGAGRGEQARRAAARAQELSTEWAGDPDGARLDGERSHQRFVVEHVAAGIEGLGRRRPDLTRDEVEVLAMDGSPFAGRLFDPVVFYDLPFETSPPVAAPEGAQSLPLPAGFWPMFSWFGWDDRARGARVFGGAWLYENTWFQGRSTYVEGLNGLVPLGPLLFDRCISSAAIHT